MNKLQLYINRSGADYKNIFNLNPDEDIRRSIADVRRALQIPDYDLEEKNTFYYVRYIETGTLIGVISTIIGHKADHVAAWIFVPADLRIEAEQLLEVVRFVTVKISGSSISADDLAEMRAVFSTEYLSAPDAPGIVSNHGDDYAFRYYGGDTDRELIDLLGVYLYQSAYLPFAGVLLVDASLGINCTGTDLTDIPLQQMVEMLPPEEHPDGFKPYLFGRHFDRTMYVPMHEQVDIVWKRPGFQDMVQQVTVDSIGIRPECASAGESKKRITPKSFAVTSLSTRRNISSQCQIFVNGIDITDGCYFTHAELVNAELTVICDGYETYQARTNLAQSSQTIIQLRERGKVYNFEISAKSSDIAGMIHFTIHTSGELTDSPIDGYEPADDIQEGPSRSNHLVYDGGNQRKSLMINIVWGIAGAIIGALMAFLCTCSGSDSAETTDNDTIAAVSASTDRPAEPGTPAKSTADVAAPAPVSAPAPAAKSAGLQRAVEYLDANKIWDKDSLDRFPDLRGLYEDLNTINRSRIIDVWGPKLADSRSFANIVNHINLGKHKKPRLKAGLSTYNPDNDHKISVQSYLNVVDP